jgi:hypothetical protein
MSTVTISAEEYNELKEKATMNESLLIKLVKGLDDIRQGKIKPWK